nr:uncharacterized protein LOC114269027 [Ipomoea batatas]
MDMDDNELNLGKNKLVEGMESQKDVLNGEKEDEDESKSLLPSKRGGLLKKPVNPKLKVQWNDRNGDKLAEILEFQPRDRGSEGDFAIAVFRFDSHESDNRTLLFGSSPPDTAAVFSVFLNCSETSASFEDKDTTSRSKNSYLVSESGSSGFPESRAPFLLWDREALELLCVKADELNAMQPKIVAGNENETAKKSLLDEFSSIQSSKKKKQVVVKEEKEPTGEQ